MKTPFGVCSPANQPTNQPVPRTPQAVTTEYATGALSGVMGTDELWLGPEISAAQQFGLISQDSPGDGHGALKMAKPWHISWGKYVRKNLKVRENI